jgi:hypothetical protein
VGTTAFRSVSPKRELDSLAKNNEAAQSQDRAEYGKLQAQAPAHSANAQSQAPANSANAQSQVQPPPPAAPSVAGGQVTGGLAAEQSNQQPANAPQSQANLRDQNQNQAGAANARPTEDQRGTQQLQRAPQMTESVEVTAAAPAMSAKKIARAPLAKVMVAGAIPRWRVSAAGAVERSIDGGRTWLSMRVSTEPVTFRSVSSVDHDVWAGGAGGALYHSADDGATWTRVTVRAFDMVLATDIARVEFTDAQHGSVTTTTGATWTTSDAGATWSIRAKPPL